METTKLQQLRVALLGILTLTVWAFIIWMACYVSTIILQTLSQIVELAAISP